LHWQTRGEQRVRNPDGERLEYPRRKLRLRWVRYPIRSPTSYLEKFEPHTVGSSVHVEYWIPAEQLSEFNASIRGAILVDRAYFGDGFRGCVPDKFGLKGKDAVSQFVSMSKTFDYSTMDFVCEVSANRKAVYLNFLFWAQFDFTPMGTEMALRDAIIEKVREAWDFNHINVPLPVCR
jgi:hypothetical protein